MLSTAISRKPITHHMVQTAFGLGRQFNKNLFVLHGVVVLDAADQHFVVFGGTAEGLGSAFEEHWIDLYDEPPSADLLNEGIVYPAKNDTPRLKLMSSCWDLLLDGKPGEAVALYRKETGGSASAALYALQLY